MGRPPKKNRAEVRLTVLPPVRLTKTELRTLKTAAKKLGIPLSRWVRDVMLEKAEELICG